MKAEKAAMRGALTRFIKRQLSMGWNRWYENAMNVARQLRMLSGAAKRMRNLKLSQAWEKWQFVSAEMKEQQRLLRRGLMKMIKRKLGMSFTKWYEEMLAAKHMAAMLKRSLGRWRNQKVSAAFLRWREWLEDLIAQRTATRRALLMWINGKLGAAYRRWRFVTDEKNAQRGQLRLALGRWTKQALSAAFLKWRIVCEKANGADPFEKAARYFLHSALGRAFNAWRYTTKLLNFEDERKEKLMREFQAATKDQADSLAAAYMRIRELENNNEPKLSLDMEETERLKRRIKELEDLLNQVRREHSGNEHDLHKKLQEAQAQYDAERQDAMSNKNGAENEARRLKETQAERDRYLKMLEDEKRAREALEKKLKLMEDRWNKSEAEAAALRKSAQDEAARVLREEQDRKRQEEADRRNKQAEDIRQKNIRQQRREPPKDQHPSQDVILGRVLKHWKQQEFSRSFNKWRDEVAVERRRTMLMKRVEKKWKKQGQSKSFNKWRDFAEAKRIQELEYQAYLVKKSPKSRSPRSSGGVSPRGAS